jgi:hypothetical protein
MELAEIRTIIFNAREILNKTDDGQMHADTQHERARNFLALAEIELKFHELESANTISLKLIDVTIALGATADTLRKAVVDAKASSNIQNRQTNTMIRLTKWMVIAVICQAIAAAITIYFQAGGFDQKNKTTNVSSQNLANTLGKKS